jgi:hypothetical protein
MQRETHAQKEKVKRVAECSDKSLRILSVAGSKVSHSLLQ